MSIPLSHRQWKAIAEDLREEGKKRKSCSLWREGTIPSSFKSFSVDADPDGNFKKIFF